MLVAIFTYSLSISCGDGMFDVKGTELNAEKGLKIKHFRELEVFFRLSEILAYPLCFQ